MWTFKEGPCNAGGPCKANYLIYPDGSHITWSYIDALQLLQCQENVRLGYKVHFEQQQKEKMKTRWPIQTLNASITDAHDLLNLL